MKVIIVEKYFSYMNRKKEGQDRELLQEMIRFAKTYAAGIQENHRTRFVDIAIVRWNTVLVELLLENGFQAGRKN